MRHKAGLLFFIVLAAAAVIICSEGLGGQQKYISYSVLGGFSKIIFKSSFSSGSAAKTNDRSDF